MGQIKQGILGGFSGKVGAVIGSSWKEISYMRAFPLKVKNPKTAAQTQQRDKFATVVGVLKTLVPILRLGWKLYTNGRSAYNAATAYTLENVIKGNHPNFQVDYEKLLISVGNLPPVQNPAIEVKEGKIHLSWEDNSGIGEAKETDKLLFALINPAKNQTMLIYDQVDREERELLLNVAHWTGDTIHAYIGFISEDGKQVATSHPICNLTIADE
ncbi:MAG: DUF6266 family protein [Bacteroidales bacterium]|nr:DUF6266 family protein [Bacteroidales bacterium]